MKLRAARLLTLLTLVIAFSAIVAEPAFAAQARRTWHASFTGTVAGTATLVLYPNSSGSIVTTMRGLKGSTTYSQMIYKGTCSKPIALIRLPGLRTTTGGLTSRTFPLTAAKGAPVWSVGPTGTVGYRIASGTWARCTTLRYEVATRIVISRYGIDLAVVHQPAGLYPYCNVAMYVSALSQPGEAGPTMIYAHARTGMFLPLLTASKLNNGAAMVGAIVQVWTSNSRLYTYQVTRVMRHVYTMPFANDYTSERLWIQTSEGPHGTPNKLIIVAKRISITTAAYSESHPRSRIVVCR